LNRLTKTNQTYKITYEKMDDLYPLKAKTITVKFSNRTGLDFVHLRIVWIFGWLWFAVIE